MPGPTKMPFDWDQANTEHIARHRVTPAEAEQVISGASLPIETGSGEERHTELGQTDRAVARSGMDLAATTDSCGDRAPGESKVARTVAPLQRSSGCLGRNCRRPEARLKRRVGSRRIRNGC